MTSRGEAEERPKRWQRREKRRVGERARIRKHGASVKRVYADAVRKRARAKGKEPRP